MVAYGQLALHLLDVFFGPLHGRQAGCVLRGQGRGKGPKQRDEQILGDQSGKQGLPGWGVKGQTAPRPPLATHGGEPLIIGRQQIHLQLFIMGGLSGGIMKQQQTGFTVLAAPSLEA